jgi:hypothetical protein
VGVSYRRRIGNGALTTDDEPAKRVPNDCETYAGGEAVVSLVQMSVLGVSLLFTGFCNKFKLFAVAAVVPEFGIHNLSEKNPSSKNT